MQRMLRVCRLLPPRYAKGADSKTATDTPDSRATSAAHSAAFPPPMIATSVSMICSTTPSIVYHRGKLAPGGLHGTKTKTRTSEIYSRRHCGERGRDRPYGSCSYPAAVAPNKRGRHSHHRHLRFGLHGGRH